MTWIQNLIECFTDPIEAWKRGRSTRKFTIGLLSVPIHILFNVWVFILSDVVILALAWVTYHVVLLTAFFGALVYCVLFDRKVSLLYVIKTFAVSYKGFSIRQELRGRS